MGAIPYYWGRQRLSGVLATKVPFGRFWTDFEAFWV